MRTKFSNRPDIVEIEQRFFPLDTPDIDRARAAKNRPKLKRLKLPESDPRTDGFYSGGRLITARSMGGIVVGKPHKKLDRYGGSGSAGTVLNDNDHHKVLDEWMLGRTQKLQRGKKVKITGDFLQDGDEEGTWLEKEVFGEVSIDDYLLLKGLETKMKEIGELGGCALKLGNMNKVPPERVALVGVVDGTCDTSGGLFSIRGGIAFSSFSVERVENFAPHKEAMAIALKKAIEYEPPAPENRIYIPPPSQYLGGLD